LPRIEIDGDITDALVDAGVLGAWDEENPQAIAEAVLKLLRLLRQE
jgi:hypothetical protein